MDISKFSLKAAVVLLLVVGSGVILLMLGSGTIPEANRDFFNFALGAWVSWAGMAVKRVLDGSDSSDQKNQAISDLSSAVVTAQAQPAAETAP